MLRHGWELSKYSCTSTALIITIASKQKENSFNGSFLFNCFSFFSSLFDQSANVYQTLKARFVLMCLLLMLMLSNEYKSKNIINLTLEPDLVPFDTFGSLIQNKFQIMCHRFLLDKNE